MHHATSDYDQAANIANFVLELQAIHISHPPPISLLEPRDQVSRRPKTKFADKSQGPGDRRAGEEGRGRGVWEQGEDGEEDAAVDHRV